MKLRKYKWLDMETRRTMYGIQANYEGRWINCCEGTKPLLFWDEKERDKKLKEIRKKERELNGS